MLAVIVLLALVGAVISSEGGGFIPTVWCALIIAFISGAGFVLIESRVSSPMLPSDFFGNHFHGSNFHSSRREFHSLYGVIFILGLYPERIREYSHCDQWPECSAFSDRPARSPIFCRVDRQRN